MRWLLVVSLLMTCTLHAQFAPGDKSVTASTFPPPVQNVARKCDVMLSSLKLEEAERCFRVALRQMPMNANLHRGLAKSLLSQGKIDSVETELQTALRLSPTDKVNGLALLEFFKNQNQAEKVVELAPVFARKWQTEPAFPASYGWALLRTGQLEAARAQYRLSVALAKKSDAEFYDNFAHALDDAGKTDQAILTVRAKWDSTNPTQADHLYLGHLLEEAKRWGEANVEYGLAEPPGTNQLETEAFADRLAKAGEVDRAISIYSDALKTHTLDPRAPERLLLLLESHKRWEELSSTCADISKGDASHRDFCEKMVQDFTLKNEFDGAVALAKVLIPLEPRTQLPISGPFATGIPLYVPDPTPNASGFERYISDLLKQLVASKQWAGARVLCNASLNAECDLLIKTLFATGQREDAVSLADELSKPASKEPQNDNGQMAGITLLQTAERINLSIDDRLRLVLEADKLLGSDFALQEFFQGQDDKGLLTDAVEALRRVSPGIELDSNFSLGPVFHFNRDFYNLAYRGYFRLVAKNDTTALDRSCAPVGVTIPAGESVTLAYNGPVSCHQIGGYVLVARESLSFGAKLEDFEFVMNPLTSNIQPPQFLTLEQAISKVPANPQAMKLTPVDEVTLGFTARKEILAKHPVFDDPAAAQAGSATFERLMQTTLAKSGGVSSFRLTLLNDQTLNAFSTAGGQIYVTSGMLPIIRKDPGMWAAVLAHETGHVVAHHQYKQYVRQVELAATKEALRQQAAAGNKVAGWAWLISLAGGHLLNVKLSRDDELEADRLGLLMMAEAGYHPDYALVLMRRLHESTGDHGKVATFLLSDHPRWETREKKVQEAYGEALRIFQTHWQIVEISPGGIPPPTN